MQAGNGCGTNSAAQSLQICHCEAPKGPWQSREGSHDFVGTCLLSTRVLRDSHVASLPGMTNLGVSRHKIHTSNIASLQGGHYPQGARRIRKAAKPPTAAQGAPLQAPPGAFAILTAVCTDCKCVAGSGMPLPYTAFASAYPTKPTHQRSSIYHADRFFEDRRSSCSQF